MKLPTAVGPNYLTTRKPAIDIYNALNNCEHSWEWKQFLMPTHIWIPLLKTNIVNLWQVQIQMKFSDVYHYSVKTQRKEETDSHKVKYKLKSDTKCTKKAALHFVCELKVVFTLW